MELGDDPEALSLRLQAFEGRPSVDTFRVTLETARQQGLETEYDHRMVEMLQWDQPGQATQVEIHLYRGDIDAALAAYESTNPFGRE